MPQTRKLFTRSGKFLLALSALCTAFIVGGAYWMQYLETDPAVASLQDELPNPNGRDAIAAAGKAFVRADDMAHAIGRARADKKLAPSSLKDKQLLYQANAAALQLVKSAVHQDFRHPAAKSTEDQDFYSLFTPTRHSIFLLVLEGQINQHNQQYGSAANSYLDALRLGSKVGRGGAIIGMLVAQTCEKIARENLWSLRGKLNATEARAAARRIESILAEKYEYSSTLRDEQAFGRVALMETLSKPGWRRSWPETHDLDLEPEVVITPVEKASVWFVSDRELSAQYQDYTESLIEQSRRKFTSRQFIAPPRHPFWKEWTASFVDMEKQSRVNALSNEVRNRFLAVEFAMQAFQREKGRLPQSLDELVPSYLEKLPADPFEDGKPLIYRRAGEKFVLYSVGPDEADDQGTPISNKGQAGEGKMTALVASKGDIVSGIS